MLTATRAGVESPAIGTTPPRFYGGQSFVRAHGEVVASFAVFAALAASALTRAPKLLEPDDYAYRASIIALSQGHIWLTNAQYLSLASRLSGGIQQWVHLANGHWISEKNPGYPLFAVVFEWMGVERVTPLFYGALGCSALFAGARRWLGPWAGFFAVFLYCSSGAALVFAWRATMPTFTDASLIVAGAGALLWTLLSPAATSLRRSLIGLLGFFALEGATFIRYTDVVELIIATIVVCLAKKAARLSGRILALWFSSVALFGAAVLAFDQFVYGGATRTGYSSGEITFSTAAMLPNLEHMPIHLLRAMPLALVSFAAVVWIFLGLVGSAHRADAVSQRPSRRRDAIVATALTVGWVAIWDLYDAYNWTVRMASSTGSDVHVVRFYVPALGLMALLGAWLLTRIPRWLAIAALVLLGGSGAISFEHMASLGGGPGGGPLGGGPGGSYRGGSTGAGAWPVGAPVGGASRGAPPARPVSPPVS